METNSKLEEKIKHIFRRQFQRMLTALGPLAIPEVAIDSVSKYVRFIEKDVIDLINKEDEDYGKFRD